jgi:GntR family transcriptional regulator
LDSKTSEKLHVQLRNIFIKKIRGREWAPGEQLPGELVLSQTYGVSRSTVRQALNALEQDGFVVRHQGKGTFVRLPKLEQRLARFYSFSEEIRAMGYTPSTVVLEFAQISADAALSSRLRLDVGSAIYRIKRLRLASDDPFAVETSYIPAALFPNMTKEKVSESGLYSLMRQMRQISPDSAIESFEAVMLTQENARLLDAEFPSAGLYLERVTFAGDVVVEFCKTTIRGDCYKYHVSLT